MSGAVDAPERLAALFTLIIPTYNRPVQLARLLKYLSRHRYPGRVLVLDSGSEASHAATLDATGSVGLDVSVTRYPQSTPVWQKFLLGAEQVATPYCGLCADDDLIVPSSLVPIVDFLEVNSDFAAAHGWYFSFYDHNDFGVTSIGYCSPSIDHADPLRRLEVLFSNYEAITYAVHRTGALQTALRKLQPLESMLTKELAGGAITLMIGKVARLPALYYGRSLAPSEPYQHWHPLEMLADSPETLLRHYSAYRGVIAGAFGELCATGDRRIDDESCLDLLFLRYLSPYLQPPVLAYLFEQRRSRASLQDTMAGVWPVVASIGQDRSPVAQPGFWQVARDLWRRWLPVEARRAVRQVSGGPVEELIHATTATGAPRKYILYPQFLGAMASLDEPPHRLATSLIDTLNAYE